MDIFNDLLFSLVTNCSYQRQPALQGILCRIFQMLVDQALVDLLYFRCILKLDLIIGGDLYCRRDCRLRCHIICHW